GSASPGCSRARWPTSAMYGRGSVRCRRRRRWSVVTRSSDARTVQSCAHRPTPSGRCGSGWRAASSTPPRRRVGGVNYEAARAELREIVAKLESGGQTLEESLALWERGEE